MDIKNETCVQKVIFRFYYQIPKRGEKKIRDKASANDGAGPVIVRELKLRLETRLERIAQMMEILLQNHDDWLVFERKDHFQMETVSFEFNKAVALLNEYGFNKQEYSLEVEYTRKWGVL